MKTRVILSTLLVALVFCGLPLKAQKVADEQKYDQIFSPDSLLSAEQLAMKYKIGELLLAKVSVKDGLFVSKISEKDFNKKAIPLYYYRMLQKNIDDMNRMIKEDNTPKEEVEKSFNEAKKDFLIKMEEMKKKGFSESIK